MSKMKGIAVFFRNIDFKMFTSMAFMARLIYSRLFSRWRFSIFVIALSFEYIIFTLSNLLYLVWQMQLELLIWNIVPLWWSPGDKRSSTPCTACPGFQSFECEADGGRSEQKDLQKFVPICILKTFLKSNNCRSIWSLAKSSKST